MYNSDSYQTNEEDYQLTISLSSAIKLRQLNRVAFTYAALGATSRSLLIVLASFHGSVLDVS